MRIEKMISSKITTFRLTLILLLLSLFRTTIRAGGGWLLTSPSTFGRGFPLPYLIFEIGRLPRNIPERFTLEQLVFDYSPNLIFSPIQSTVGLIIDVIFWLILSALMLKLARFVLKRFSKQQTKTLVITAAVFTVLGIFVPSVDVSQKLAIGRGIPLPFLERYPLGGGGYSNFNFNPFYLVADFLIFSFLLTPLFFVWKLVKRNIS